jgi:cytochrome c-type biogenesis protein CcmH/NrfG
LITNPANADAEEAKDTIEICKETVGLLPNFAEGWKMMGDGCVKLGRTKDAITASKEAVKLKPEYGEAWYGLGGCYEKEGRSEDAAKAFEHAQKLNPELFKKSIRPSSYSYRRLRTGSAVAALRV